MAIRVASAPVSWGVMEETEDALWLPPEQTMAEIKQAGFDGTELGALGYYPTEVGELRAALDRHGLTLCSAFAPVGLFEPQRREADLAGVRHIAGLLHEIGRASCRERVYVLV